MRISYEGAAKWASIDRALCLLCSCHAEVCLLYSYITYLRLGEVFDLTVETGYRGVGVDCRFMWRCRLNIVRATQKANSQTAILSFWKLWRKIENNLHVTKICRYFAPALMKEILLKSKVLKKSFSKKIFQKDLEVVEKRLTFAPASMKITLHECESS